MLRARPCRICRKWFHPDRRVGDRQRVCSSASCQAARRKQTQAAWRASNPDYFTARRLKQRAAKAPAPAPTPTSHRTPLVTLPPPLHVPPPLDQVPWDVAQDLFGAQGADFIAILSKVLLAAAQDQRRAYPPDSS
jgi:hypothetical protein